MKTIYEVVTSGPRDELDVISRKVYIFYNLKQLTANILFFKREKKKSKKKKKKKKKRKKKKIKTRRSLKRTGFSGKTLASH